MKNKLKIAWLIFVFIVIAGNSISSFVLFLMKHYEQATYILLTALVLYTFHKNDFDEILK